MSAYYIWDPHIVLDDPKTLEFITTRGDADAIAQGTEEFTRALLKDIGVDATISSWSVEPCRTKYFSEYLGEEDWRDNWQLVWRVRVVTIHRLGALPKTEVGWIETNATDESWTFETRLGDEAVVTCLVLSDFRSQANLTRAKSALVHDDRLAQMRARYSVRMPTFESYGVGGGSRQLLIDLGRFPGQFFSGGADYAERAMELCKMAKGTVHFEARRS